MYFYWNGNTDSHLFSLIASVHTEGCARSEDTLKPIIFVNKPRDRVHKPGQPVAGVVEYAVDGATEFKDIALSFFGIGYCSWKEANPTTDDSYDYTKYEGSERYFSRKINILKNFDDAVKIQAGAYNHPFEFILPDNIPTSFNDSNCTISYGIKVEFVKTAFFGVNKIFRVQIPVYGYVTPPPERPMAFEVDKVLSKPFSSRKHKITLKGNIIEALLSPGEYAKLWFSVTNDSDVTITSVTTQLYERTSYISDCGRTKTIVQNVPECSVETPSVPKNGAAKMSSMTPTLTEMYSVQDSRVMRREYELVVTVRLPLPHRNMKANVPIVIGEGRESIEIGLDALTFQNANEQSKASLSE